MAPILRLRVDHANGCTVGVLAERPRAQHAILTPTQPQRVHARNVLAHVRQAGGLGGVRCDEARGPPRSAVKARLVCLGPRVGSVGVVLVPERGERREERGERRDERGERREERGERDLSLYKGI